MKEQKKTPSPQPNEIIIQSNGTAIDPDGRPPGGSAIGKMAEEIGIDKKAIGKLIMDVARDEVSERIGIGRRKPSGKRSAFQQVVDGLRETWWIPIAWIFAIGITWIVLKLLSKLAGV